MTRTYVRNPLRVQARQLAGPELVKTNRGEERGDSGMWLVTYPNGSNQLMPDALFHENFSLDPEEMFDDFSEVGLAY